MGGRKDERKRGGRKGRQEKEMWEEGKTKRGEVGGREDEKRRGSKKERRKKGKVGEREVEEEGKMRHTHFLVGKEKERGRKVRRTQIGRKGEERGIKQHETTVR